MKNFRDITCWENRRRLGKVIEFRGQVELYMNSLTSDSFGLYESKESSTIKTRTNYMIQEVVHMVHSAGVSTYVNHDHDRIEIISNIFMLRDLHIPLRHVINALERAIGVYRSDRRNSIIRTFNPLWWVVRILYWFAHIPFRLLGAAGFDATRAEESTLGRVIKFALLTLPAALATYLTLFDHWDTVKLLFDL